MSYLIEWDDKLLSIRAICNQIGVNENSVYYRMKKTGESAKAALLYYKNKYNNGKQEKIELNGRLLSIKNYCKQLNYDYELIIRYKASQPDKSYTEILKEWPSLSEDNILSSLHLYNIWHGMLGRCENPKHPGYKWYGGKKPKPVKVCEEWHDYLIFKNQVWNKYIEHVKKYGIYQTTLNRKKSWYNYSYNECEWNTWEEQGRNKASTKYLLPCNNYQKTLMQHCLQNDYSYDTIRNYIKQYNLAPDEALAMYLKQLNN